MTGENNHINYSVDDIEKYRKGEMSAEEMYAMEKASLDDPFLADAMDGYRLRSTETTLSNDINDLQKRLAARVSDNKVVPVGNFNWWKLAAAVIVLSAGTWVYISLNNKNAEKNIATIKNDTEKATAAKPDSASAFITAGGSTDTSPEIAVLKDRIASDKNAPAGSKAKQQAHDSSSVASVTNTAPEKNIEKEAETISADRNIPSASAEKREELAKNEDRKEAKVKNIVIAKPEIKNNADKSINATINGKVKGVSTDEQNKVNFSGGRAGNIFPNTFNGKVVDQLNQPVANALIQIPNLNIATQTDKKGNFSFKAPDTALSVSVASVGFETQNLKMQNNDASANQITLKPAAGKLEEVVVIGYGTQKKRNITRTKDVTIKILDAEPTVDWNTYNDYLEKNKKTPDEAKDIHGEVLVDFIVDSKGELKNFSIAKSLDEDLDEEAIRLIKEGPAWRLLKGKKAKVSVIVKF